MDIVGGDIIAVTSCEEYCSRKHCGIKVNRFSQQQGGTSGRSKR